MKIKTREDNNYKWIEFEHIGVEVQKEVRLLNRDHEVKLNWSALGSVSIKRTEEFIKTLQEAVKLAKKEKKSNG